jgi:peptidoglycan/LPS O-acetylase OafA/YrhL
MLASISLAMAVRAELGRRAIPWMLGAGWGFFNCMISGRRKAIYFVLVFAVAFLIRYIRRIKPAQIVSIAVAAAVLGYVVHNISTNETSSVYATGAVTTGDEVAQRLEGGLLDTIRQFGFMGAGLGTATQGVQYLLGPKQTMGWQEGGLGKLAIELGVPGLLAAMLFAFAALRTMMKISAIPDHPYTSQIGRATLFALIAANIANFAASAQAYSDPVLTLITCFIAGCLFATITLDERAAAAANPPAVLPRLTPVRT